MLIVFPGSAVNVSSRIQFLMSSLTDRRQNHLAGQISIVKDSCSDAVLGDNGLSTETLYRMLKLAESSLPALARTTYQPGHFTASALVLSPNFQSLLLIRHRKLKMWLQPGGHIEPDDLDVVAAARRELHEETGLGDVHLHTELYDCDIHQIPAWGMIPSHLHFDVRVLFLARSIDVFGGDDAEEAKWFPLSELASDSGSLDCHIDTDESVRRVARRLHATFKERPQTGAF